METRETSPGSAADAAAFRMIDVGPKAPTARRAIASGRLYGAPETLRMIRERKLPKGDALALAEVAGLMGAKKAPETIPLCHPLMLSSVRVWTEAHADRIEVFCETKAFERTGVEMEALAGVTAALLCLYDLAKQVDPALTLGDIRVELKEGGKTGLWRREDAPAVSAVATKNAASTSASVLPLAGVPCAVVTVSDRCHRGLATDESGPAVAAALVANGAPEPLRRVVPDEPAAILTTLRELLEAPAARVILLTGGTGLSPGDVTPETLQSLGGREIPGIGERLRAEGLQQTPTASLSRSVAYLVGDSLLVALPGSRKGAAQGAAIVATIAGHVLHVADGGGHR